MRTRRVLAQSTFVLAILSSIASLNCSGAEDGAVGETHVETTVGASGGSVESPDGVVAVDIPPGSLVDDVQVTIDKIASPGAGNVGDVYEIGPTGTKFNIPIALTFKFDVNTLNGEPAANLRPATYSDGWQVLSSPTVDEAHGFVTGTTTHLSPYGVILIKSAVATCRDVYSTVTPSGGYDASATASSADASYPADASGGGSVYGPKCGSPYVCTPGERVASCGDTPLGYTATCCASYGDAGYADGGSYAEGGYAYEGGYYVDASGPYDSSTKYEGGTSKDGGTIKEGGTGYDAGYFGDSGYVAIDAGSYFGDAGKPTDAGAGGQ